MHERRSEPRTNLDIIIHHSDPPVTGVDYNFVRLTSGQKFIRALEAQGFKECWIFQQRGMTYIAWVVPEG